MFTSISRRSSHIMLTEVYVDEPILYIWVQLPGTTQMHMTCVRFNSTMTSPLPGWLTAGTRWCFAHELETLGANKQGRARMLHSKVVI